MTESWNSVSMCRMALRISSMALKPLLSFEAMMKRCSCFKNKRLGILNRFQQQQCPVRRRCENRGSKTTRLSLVESNSNGHYRIVYSCIILFRPFDERGSRCILVCRFNECENRYRIVCFKVVLDKPVYSSECHN